VDDDDENFDLDDMWIKMTMMKILLWVMCG
jgi:hypothetical protein